MKKERDDSRLLSLKITRIMKIMLMFILVGILQISAITYAQEHRISVSVENGTFYDVVSQIEKQSEFMFFYKSEEIDNNQRINLNVTNKLVSEILNEITKNNNLAYKITGKHIIITRVVSENQVSKRIKGCIKDSSGEPIVGANVVEKGTTNGAITDIDGNFSIEVATGAVLQISYIGYNTQDIRITDKTSYNVVLKEDAEVLDEVVVVGYGTMRKRDLTGAVSQLKGDEIADLPLRSASDALQGKAAGVTITSTSGTPGAMGTVRIRGVGTINDNDPLYVVDGLPQSGIGWLNPRDIESMEVLKDASAQAIYGARAANGVILITTKKGATGASYKSTIDFDMMVGVQNAAKTYDMLDAEGFIKYKNMAYEASNKPLLDDFATPEKIESILSFLEKNGGRAGTNWWNEIKNTNALSQNYNLSLSGGMDKLRYRSSFAYMKQDGIIKSTDYERLSGRLNLDSEVYKWLNVSLNTNVIYETRRTTDENNAYTSTVFSALTSDPITPAYRNNLVDIPDFLNDRIMGGYEPTNPFSQYTGILYSNKPNPLAQTERKGQNRWKGLTLKNNLSADIKLFPFLSFKSSLGLDLTRTSDEGFSPKYYLSGTDQVADAKVERGIGQRDFWVFENYFSYNDKFGDHAVSAMAGTSAEKERYETVKASKEGFVNNDYSQQIINAGTKNPGASGSVSYHTMNSYFCLLYTSDAADEL